MEQELIHLFIWQKHWTQQLIIWSWAEVVWLLMKSKRYSATNSYEKSKRVKVELRLNKNKLSKREKGDYQHDR